MRERLTAEAYVQSKEKIRNLEARIETVERRTDINPSLIYRFVRSYRSFMKKLIADIEKYESHQELLRRTNLAAS